MRPTESSAPAVFVGLLPLHSAWRQLPCRRAAVHYLLLLSQDLVLLPSTASSISIFLASLNIRYMPPALVCLITQDISTHLCFFAELRVPFCSAQVGSRIHLSAPIKPKQPSLMIARHSSCERMQSGSLHAISDGLSNPEKTWHRSMDLHNT